MVTPASPVDPDVVRVWYATVDRLLANGPDGLARAFTFLRDAERVRYNRFRNDVDRHMFLLGRVMARTVVADALGVPVHDWRWREGPRGRPEIDRSDCPVSFNLSHSAGLVVCAITRTGVVGVDVEHRGRAPLEHALVTRCCSPDEAADVDAQGDDWRDHFLKFWTLKESYLKAVSLGISVHLPDVRFRLTSDLMAAPAFTGSLTGADAGWTFELRRVVPNHYVAVATTTPRRTHPAILHADFPDEWWP